MAYGRGALGLCNWTVLRFTAPVTAGAVNSIHPQRRQTYSKMRAYLYDGLEVSAR